MAERFLIPGAGVIRYEKPKPTYEQTAALAELATIASVRDLKASKGYVSAETAHERNGMASAKRRAARKAGQ